MNGIEKITARITAEAEEAAAAVTADAEKAAESVRTAYKKKADEAYETRMNAGNEEIRRDSERAERAARLQGRKDTLALKQSILSRAYDKAKEKLLALPRGQYCEFLASQAGNAAVTGHETVVLNSQDKPMGETIVSRANEIAASRGLPAALTLSDESGDFSGGLKLREGSVEVNCTVDTLLDLGRSRLDAEVAAILFD
jgi:V/A-type H+/Na+-transporting ATPase subunit E